MDGRISVEFSDITDFTCDIIVLKYAQGFYGSDAKVADLLKRGTSDPPDISPLPGKHMLLPTRGKIAAPFVLFVGVKEIFKFDYAQIRRFASSSLRILAKQMPAARHIAMTMHGIGFGLDERESFMAQLGGLLDALGKGPLPASLERITIVERDQARANRIKKILREYLSAQSPARSSPSKTRTKSAVRSSDLERQPSPESKIDAGITSDTKPHVFIAMPYSEEMEDTYIFGIQQPVNAAGFLCERVDMSTFIGDILTRIKSRIESSTLVIADLTGANANVYLEVGYAWGKDRPTLLLSKKGEEPKFDVRGHRRIVYKSIADLAKQLEQDLRILSQQKP